MSKLIALATSSLAAALLFSCARPRPVSLAPPPLQPALQRGAEPKPLAPGPRPPAPGPAAIAPGPQPLADDLHEDDPFGAAQYFIEQRVPGGGLLPIERYLEADRHAQRMPRYSLRAGRLLSEVASDAAATFGTWESLGPGNVGGRTRGLVIHPRDSNTMWLGGATGGVWKSTDGGKSWKPQTDFAPVLSINSLVIDPNDPNTLYAGTGEQTQNWRGAGIFKTTDGGQTWNQLAATSTADFYFVNNLAVSRAASSQVYAATNTGLWASTDGGASWTLSLASPDGGPAPTLTGGTTHGCFDVAVQPGQPADVVFAVCHPPGSLQYAIFRNSDAARGGTWAMVHSDPRMWYTALAVAPSQPGTIYAVSVTSDTGRFAKALLAVYRSTNNGNPGTWETRTSNQDANRLNSGILSVDSAYSFGNSFCNGSNPNFNGQAGYNLALAVDPVDPNRVWAAGIGIFRSDDGGANWGYAYIGDHPDQHLLAFDPGFDGAANQVLYNVNDGGVYKTTQARGKTGTCSSQGSAVTWTTLNNGYGTTQFYHGVPYPGGGAYVGGTQDNQTVRGSDARGPNQWDYIYGGDGGVSRVDPANAGIVYVEYVHGAMAKSVDGGNNFRNATTGITEDSGNFPFIAWYLFDPTNSLRLYVGGAQLWRTEDGAAHWTAASAPVDAVTGALDNIRSIAVSPADPNLVLFGMSHGRIFRNTDTLAATGDTVWASVQPRSGNVSHLEFDTRQPSTVYATYTTFNTAPGDQHVYRSTDGGVTWAGIDGAGSTGLPDVPVETLLVDPDDSNRLYIGTDLGVYASFDGGRTWVRDDNPFANAITTTLAIDRTGGTKYLYAFTYGRGVWRVPLSGGGATPCTYSISPSSLALDANGGTFSVDLTTSPGCAWSVIPPVTASTAFASAQGPAYGSGSGKVFLTVPANHTTSTRTNTLLVQNQILIVTEAGAVSSTIGDEVSRSYVIASLPFEGFGSNSALTANANDPRHSCTGSVNFRTGWLTFTAPASGNIQVSVESLRSDNSSANSGIAIAAYPLNAGSLGGELACATVPKDSAGPIQDATLIFPVVQGATYAIETASLSTGAVSDLAALYIGVGPSPGTPALDVGPAEVTIKPGDTRRFQAIAQNLPNAAVRWTVSPQVGFVAPDGTYTAPPAASPSTVTITAQSFSNPALQAVSMVTIQEPPSVSLGATAVANAASFQAGPVAPGEIVTIFGSGIGPANLTTAQLTAQGKLASTLSGTQVFFDGIPAPLVYVAAQVVSAIVPYEVAGQQTTQMVVVRNGQSTQPATLQVAAAAPAFFTADSSGSGQVAAQNEDGTLNGPQNGAPAGSVVALYATGEGQTTPGGVNGRIAGKVVPKPVAPVSVRIGGVDAEIVYAGAAPEAVAGLLQVNVKVPASLKAGANAVAITMGNTSSRPDATITLR
ncbi:MAG: hypothetical protein LAQ69_15440 [Acidobacteriia bacterium]|nr:hypothetical protein [Terriglobia bacterium]